MEGKQEDKLVEDIYNDWRSALSECIGVSPNTLFVFGMGSPKNDIYFYERFRLTA